MVRPPGQLYRQSARVLLCHLGVNQQFINWPEKNCHSQSHNLRNKFRLDFHIIKLCMISRLKWKRPIVTVTNTEQLVHGGHDVNVIYRNLVGHV